MSSASLWLRMSAVLVVILLGTSHVLATDQCKVCDANKGQGELDNCFKDLLKNPSKNCFTLNEACDPASMTSTLTKTADAKPITDRTVAAACYNNTLKVTADGDKLVKVKDTALTLSVVSPNVSFSAKATYAGPPQDTGDGEGGGDAGGGSKQGASTPAPIDVEPISIRGTGTDYSTLLKSRQRDAKYIYVHENLAIDPASDKFVTETDRVVVRVIARKALLCRYYVTSDDKNEYKAEVGRVGGRTGLADVLKKSGLVGGEIPSDKTRSCGYELTEANGPMQKGHFVVQGPGAYYSYVDFTFGPFTNEQLAFHVFRHDREFQGNDLEGELKVPNHQRYVGWIDLMVVGSTTFGRNDVTSIERDNGTELTRIKTSDQSQQIDIVAQVKFFVACNGSSNDAFKAQDLSAAGVCFGLGSGLSLTHPTQRFYPLGLNLTVARYLSFNSHFMLERSKSLSSGYNSGDLFSGTADDLPTHERLIPGVSFGVGLDPTLLGDLIGQIVKAGL